MPTVCKITLDAEEYRQELTKVVSESRAASAELEQALTASPEAGEVKIEVKADTDALEAVKPQLGAVATEAKKTQDAVEKVVPGTLRGKAAAAFGAIRKEMNSTQGGAKKFLSSVLAGGGAIGVVMAGVTAVVKLIAGALEAAKEAWIAHTQTLQANAADLARVGNELQKTISKENEALNVLRELNRQETLSNTQKDAAAKAVKVLQSSYRGLNIEVDATTGKLKNFDAVNIAIMRRQTQAQLQNIESQIKANSEVTNRSQGGLKNRGGVGEYWQRWKQQYGFGTANEDSEAHKKATESNIELRKQQAELRRKQREQVEAYRSQRRAENADLAAGNRDRGLSFAQRKADDAFTDARGIDAKIANRRQSIDAERGGKRRTDAEAALKTAEADYAKAQQAGDKDGMLSAQKEILLQQQAILASDERIYGFERQIDELKKQQAEAYKKLTDQAQFELEYNKLIVAGEFQKAEALKLEHELRGQNLQLTEEQKKKILAQREAMQRLDASKMIAEAKEEVALQQLLVEGKYEEYEAEKLRLEMKRQGKMLTEEETKAILEQRKALAAQNLKKNLQEQAYGLYGQAMERAGKGREFEEQKNLRDARKAKGRDLTEEETAQVKKLSMLAYALNNTRETQLGDTSIHTNSLTARGGFAGGAKAPDSEKINREIAATNKQQLEALRQIQGLCEKLGSF